MPVEPSAISGMAAAVPTNVAVTTAGYLITTGSTASGGTVVLSTSALNPVTLAPSTSLNTVAITVSTGASVSSVAVTTTAAVAGTTYNASRKGFTLYNQGTSAVVIAYTTVAATTTYSVSLASGAYWEMPVPLSALPISVAVSTTLTGGTASVFVSELT